jgi:hypothetical protein
MICRSMLRRTRRLLPAKLPPRLPLVALLAAWLLAQLAPLLHVHVGHHGPEHEHLDHAGACCEQPPATPNQSPMVAASCPDGGSCRNPLHHHHSHEGPFDDAIGCHQCASFWERPVEASPRFFLAPLSVVRTLAAPVRQAPQELRAAMALARGPPAGGGLPRRCALLVA